MNALVEQLGGEGAQDGRAAAGAGADQDVRRGVDVDGPLDPGTAHLIRDPDATCFMILPVEID